MSLPASALKFQPFDADAFGVPFYRLTDPRSPVLERELAALALHPPFIVDAKLPADDITSGARLLELGFRKVCVQIELHHSLIGAIVPPVRSQIVDQVKLPKDILYAHAAQFVFDRFALDSRLPPGGHDRLFLRWISNSLEGIAHSVALCGNNFITFKEESGDVKIDLVSVLHKEQGIATDLLMAVLCAAQERGSRHVKVVTECENRPAVRLYLKTGFSPVHFYSVFHLC